MPYADLEIGLHRRDAESYAIELRFTQPDSEADVRLGRGARWPARFDPLELRQLLLDHTAYGRELAKSLFGNVEMRQAFAKARAAAASQDVPLRLRLFIGPSAPELHSLRWETLQDPDADRDENVPLLTGEHILFSRYLSSQDMRPVRLRPRATLKALLVVANPNDLAEYDLAPLNVAEELARARAGLGDIAVSELPSAGQATLQAMIDHLLEGVDILYLVAHGLLIDGQPLLWLEQADGSSAQVEGSELANRLRELRQQPRLVVLASCQSAGTGEEARSSDEGALAALGPRLAEVGIPAVLAMQGNVTMQTVAEFMPRFFQELQHDGQIDRAVAVARGAVRERPDWWAPTLFMRLKSGRIWYTPGFGEDQRGMEKWPALLRNIKRGRCTPILGPGLAESLLGSRREIARRWADTYHFPMAPHDRDDLPQVAQYLAVNQDPMFPKDELGEYLRRELKERIEIDVTRPEHQALFSQVVDAILPGASLDQLITTVGKLRQISNPSEPHMVLARLDLPIYITTDPSSLLVDALATVGKEPVLEICRWNERIEMLPSIYDDEPDYRPTARRPLVFHLFGHISEPDSLVITEDDYFDYLIGVTRNNDLIPAVVRRHLAATGLLFLGFRMEEWDFRVLFRSIMKQEGGMLRSGYANVAAQIDPEGGQILEPERARRYLESYFQKAEISIYWGSVEGFLKELEERMA